jgi:ribosome maturation factor RimP
MNLPEKNIEEISKKIIEVNGFFLIDFVVRGNTNNRVFEIFIDGEKNISADDCAIVSREVNKVIEDNQLITSSYRLDVSSPGVDRPLIYLKQYPKHIGRKFEVSYIQNDSTKKIMGTLKSTEADNLFFEINKQELIINFNNIKKAKVILSFS